MKTLKSILSLTIAATLSSCAFSKEDPNKDKTDNGVAGQQGPLAQKDALKVSYQAVGEYHKFDVVLEWPNLENCLPRLQKENLTTQASTWIPVSDEHLIDGVYNRVDANQSEGHELRYNLMCLNSVSTPIDIKEIKLPYDLVIRGSQNLENIVAKMGFLKSSAGELSINVERFALTEGSVLETESKNVRVEFKEGYFERSSLLRNHNSLRLHYPAAAEANVLGQSGSTITLVGDRAVGNLNLDRKGYPGRNGQTGQNADPSLHPARNPAVGRNSTYAFEIKTRTGGDICGGRGGGRDFRPSGPCEYLSMKCVRPADSGPTGFRGAPGGRGGQAHPGGNTGKIFINVKDRTNLVVNQTSAGGVAGQPGQGGNGGLGGSPGTPGQSLWLEALRGYMGMAPAPQDSDAKVMDRTGIRADPCPAPSVGSVGPLGPQGPEGARSIDGLVEPIFVWDQDANSYLEWRTN